MSDLTTDMERTQFAMLKTAMLMADESAKMTGDDKANMIEKAHELMNAAMMLDEWIVAIKEINK